MNPIHFNDAIATAAGLPGVLAHGMLTAGIALQAIVDWVGDPSGVISYETRFTRPVVVDAVDGADLSMLRRSRGSTPQRGLCVSMSPSRTRARRFWERPRRTFSSRAPDRIAGCHWSHRDLRIRAGDQLHCGAALPERHQQLVRRLHRCVSVGDDAPTAVDLDGE